MRLSRLLESPIAYRLWQAPFRDAKLAPLKLANDLTDTSRVLDVGCGPGTNARLFHHAEYLGLDIDERYIAYARRRYRGEFQAVDVTKYEPHPGRSFDFVLMNSLLHHVDDEGVFSILRSVRKVLSPDGHVHILDLVMPRNRSIARWLARHDRGNFVRPLSAWEALFSEVFRPVSFEPYSVNLLGIPLWHMVYVKGRRPSPEP